MKAKRLIAMLLGSALVAASLPTAAFAENIVGSVQQAAVEVSVGTEQELAPATSGQKTSGSYGTEANGDTAEAVVTQKSADAALKSITLENAASTETDKTITDGTVPYRIQAKTTKDGKTSTSWEYSKLEFTGAATADGTKLSADQISSYQWAVSDKEDGTFTALDETSKTLALTRDILLKTPYVRLTVTGTYTDGKTCEGSSVVQVTRVACPSTLSPKAASAAVDDTADTFTFYGASGVTYAYKLGSADAVTLEESKDGETNSDKTVTYVISVGDKAYDKGAIQVYAAATDAEKAEEGDVLYAASDPISNDTAYTVKDTSVSHTSTDKDKYAGQVFTAVFAPATGSTADVSALVSEQATIAAVDRKQAVVFAEDSTTTTTSTTSSSLKADDVEEAISCDKLTPTELSTSLSVTTSSGTTTVPVGTVLSVSSAASGSTTTSTAQYLVGAAASTSSATLYATTASSGTNAVYTYNTSANTLVKGSSTVTLTDKTSTDCQYVTYKGVPYQVSYTVKSGSTLYAYLYNKDGSAAGYATLNSAGTEATALALNSASYTAAKNSSSESTYFEADNELYELTDLFAQNISAKNSSGTAVTTGADGTLTITIKGSDVIKAAVGSENPIGMIRKGSDSSAAYTELTPTYDSTTETLTATVSSASLDSNTDYLVIDEDEVTFTSLKTVAASTRATSSTASTSTTTTSSGTSTTSSVSTGDTSSLVLWTVIMLIAAGAIVALVVISRKRKNR